MPRILRVQLFFIVLALIIGACQPKPEAIPVSTAVPLPTIGIPLATATAPAIPTATFVPNPTPVPCSQPGSFYEDEYPSPHQEYEPKFNIYLPPCYAENTDMRYPLLILLHGSYGDYRTWGVLGLAKQMDALIAQGMPPFIVAMPTIPYAEDLGRVLNTTALGEELLGYLDTHYRTLPEVKYRALGGLSYGALWTLRLNDEIPGTWGKLGLHSTAMSAVETNLLAANIASRMPEVLPKIWVDCGRNDEYVGACIDTDILLSQHKIRHEFKLNNGNHMLPYWEKELPNYLLWYAKGWDNAQEKAAE